MNNYDFIKNRQIEEIKQTKKDILERVESNLRYFENFAKKEITADNLRNLITNLNMAL